MLTGNKGEWSEVYALFKLLADQKIYAADGDLRPMDNVFFPIIKVIRDENNQLEDITGDMVQVFLNGELVNIIPAEVFQKEANFLRDELLQQSGSRAFSIPATESFMNEIYCYRISMPSRSKSDIKVQLIDINTGYSPTVGFSIKSELGSAPTLLNAGKTTNFKYEIQTTYPNFLQDINEIFRYSGGKAHTDVRKRIERIIELKSPIKYTGMSNQTFKDNLVLIDSCMDAIISETLLYFYRDGISDCESLVAQLEQLNPMGYGNVNSYRYKFKKFLSAVALGLKPATPWDGIDEASGGYIVVTKTGDVLAYHLYNRNYFEEYLLKHTKYDTASTSRHGFGEVYEENGRKYINLNLQIRFK